jgi:hypothetical protein
VWEFVRTLSPVWYELKKAVLVKLLEASLASEGVDEELLTSYLELAGVSTEDKRVCTSSYPAVRSTPTVVYTLLDRVMLDTKRITPYNKYFPDTELEPRLARLMVQHDVDAKPYLDKMSPAELKKLQDTHEFAWISERTQFFSKDVVTLKFRVRNVFRIDVRVFEVSTAIFYAQDMHARLDSLLNYELLGLEPQTAEVLTYTYPPHRVSEEVLALPSLPSRGIFIVELLINGQSTKAAFSKGQLKYRTRCVPTGTEVVIMDEDGNHLEAAKFYLRDHEYRSGDVIPFSAEPGQVPFLMEYNRFVQPGTLELYAESYTWRASVHVAREELVAGRLATGLLTVRLSLLELDHQALPLDRLAAFTLTLTSETMAGITNQLQLPIVLDPSGATPFQFRVPEALLKLSVDLKAHINHVGHNQKTDFTHTHRLWVNKFLRSSVRSDYYLSRTPLGHRLSVVGKGGERCFLKRVTLSLTNKWAGTTATHTVTLNEHGEYLLGDLSGYTQLQIRERHWRLDEEQTSQIHSLRILAGETISLPYYTRTPMDSVGLGVHFHLFCTKTRAPHPVQLRNNRLEIASLPPGSYRLALFQLDTEIDIEVLARTPGYDVVANPQPPSFTSAQFKDDQLLIKVEGASATTRVHVFGSHFLPPLPLASEGAHFAFPLLDRPSLPSVVPVSATEPGCRYSSLNSLSPAIQYIWQRRFNSDAEKQIGNMLPQPSLLLKRWNVAKPIQDPVYDFERLRDRQHQLKAYQDYENHPREALDSLNRMARKNLQDLCSALGDLASLREYDSQKQFVREGGGWAQVCTLLTAVAPSNPY